MISARALNCLLVATSLAAAAPGAKQDVVVIGGALTEIVYALGVAERIAATDTTSTFPQAASATPKVGYQRALNSEGVLAMKPSLVIAAHEAGPPDAIAQIKAAGVEFAQLPGEFTFDAARAKVKRIGALLDREQEAAALDKKLVADWEQAQSSVARYMGKPRVLFILGHAGPMHVAGNHTAADAMIRYAGGVNALSSFSGYKPLAPEAVVAVAPEVILTTTQGVEAQGGVQSLLEQPGIALTAAAKNKRVVVMDALALLGFGPRLPQVVRELARQLHEGL
ncbi:MAG: heme/hemin ABC transporter substrate-binding protein [Burkholderiales bacterium]